MDTLLFELFSGRPIPTLSGWKQSEVARRHKPNWNVAPRQNPGPTSFFPPLLTPYAVVAKVDATARAAAGGR